MESIPDEQEWLKYNQTQNIDVLDVPSTGPYYRVVVVHYIHTVPFKFKNISRLKTFNWCIKPILEGSTYAI